MTSPKVIGIGLHKSGTSSLAAALFTLGYEVTGHGAMGPGYDFGRLRSLDPATARAEVWTRLQADLEQADAAQDSPWWEFYREIDEAFPGSRFILTVREREKWLSSVQTHFGRRSNEWDRWMFDDKNSVDDPQVFLDRYDAHHAGVEAHFADRPADLLVIDMAEGLSWGPLCDFLGLPTPAYTFPKANAAGDREAGLAGRVIRRVKRKLDIRHGRSDVQRTLGLYDRCHTVTAQARDTVSASNGDLETLQIRVLPLVKSLKSTIGVPYAEDAAGAYGDDPVSQWQHLEFEVRHAIGQVTSFTIDLTAGDGTVEVIADEILDELSGFGNS
ncbi:MAG: sulfotransferase family protein [Actinomycetota bacterium]